MEKKTLTQKETAARLFHYLKPQGFFILVSIVMAALTVAGTLYLPILMGEAIDCILGPGQVDFAAIRGGGAAHRSGPVGHEYLQQPDYLPCDQRHPQPGHG